MRTLALHQWRRNKGSFLGFGAIILIAACMLGSALTLLCTVGPRYTALADELHTADVDIVVPRTAATADVRDVIDRTTGVAAVEPHDVLLMDAQIHDFRGTDFAIRTMITDADAPRTLNQTRVLATAAGSGDLTIAQYTAQFGQFAPGERIELRIGGHDESFRIAGVVEEMEFGNAGSQILAFSAPAARFARLERAYPQARMTEYAVSVSAGADPRAVRSRLERALAQAGTPVAIDASSVRATRMMVSRLIILILVVFAVLVTVVILALCTFHIRNIVETDRTDMGVLKALGYTGQMISHAMMAPYLLVCVGATVIGLALSTLATPAIGSLIALQAGFTFHAQADARAWLITIAALAGVTLLFAWIGVRSLRALQPIEAIRGISARSQRHTVRPLNRMPGNARTAISLQQAAASPSRNLLVGCMTFLMTLIVSFAATLTYNAAVTPDNLYNTLSTETPQVVATPAQGETTEAMQRIRAIPGVQNVIAYTTARVGIDGTQMPAFVSDDFDATRNDIRYEGNHPATAHEIAMGSALADAHPIGSKVTVSHGGTALSYTVVGYIQSVNDGGTVCELTNAGYTRLDPDFAHSPHTLYVYCDGADTARVIRAIESTCAGLVTHTTDMERMRETSQQMYGSIMSAVSLAMLILAIGLTGLVLMMVVRSTIVRERRRFGILKALGYTSGQLMRQIAAALMPATAAGAVLGALVAGMAARPVTDALFATVGVMRSQFDHPALLPIAAALALTAVQGALALGFATPIRTISPYQLITE
ncbi:FtsX-like permease family protein [Bifidobacterium pseudolongum subsp. globosum]|uniref:ABC transporter permease n=1 Tax=Bifidobacterium pseudolongum TaxID=1694 RepID=UPI001F52EDB9|nr:FtsX-like permease family protein [Bifidobacterium pseudolongum]MCI1193931.1 FtsX-like permease family protein [Bifidobacterium pseudolongum subsp. globosum]UNP92376.1 FtsX-like permease family protein [Bifidobacterium pseudolongum subsp. globosum]UNZ08982.1 FtsX-like permease family protein [Bifidobacterium pseudolongum subsp. globosum]